MYHLLALLELAFRALHESDTGTHGVVVSRSCKAPPELRHAVRGAVDTNDVAGGHLFLLERLDHARAEVIDRLHFCGAERDPSGLLGGGLAGGGLVRLDLHHFSFDDVRLLHDADADGPVWKSTSESGAPDNSSLSPSRR